MEVLRLVLVLLTLTRGGKMTRRDYIHAGFWIFVGMMIANLVVDAFLGAGQFLLMVLLQSNLAA